MSPASNPRLPLWRRRAAEPPGRPGRPDRGPLPRNGPVPRVLGELSRLGFRCRLAHGGHPSNTSFQAPTQLLGRTFPLHRRALRVHEGPSTKGGLMKGFEVVTSDDCKIGHVVDVEGDHLVIEHGLLKKTRHAVPETFAHA